MQGWECPKCGSVYSPFVEKCENCGGDVYIGDDNIWHGIHTNGCPNQQCFCDGSCYADRPKGM